MINAENKSRDAKKENSVDFFTQGYKSTQNFSEIIPVIRKYAICAVTTLISDLSNLFTSLLAIAILSTIAQVARWPYTSSSHNIMELLLNANFLGSSILLMYYISTQYLGVRIFILVLLAITNIGFLTFLAREFWIHRKNSLSLNRKSSHSVGVPVTDHSQFQGRINEESSGNTHAHRVDNL